VSKICQISFRPLKSVENIFYNDTKYPDFELSRFEIREFQKKFLFRSGTTYVMNNPLSGTDPTGYVSERFLGRGATVIFDRTLGIGMNNSSQFKTNTVIITSDVSTATEPNKMEVKIIDNVKKINIDKDGNLVVTKAASGAVVTVNYTRATVKQGTNGGSGIQNTGSGGGSGGVAGMHHRLLEQDLSDEELSVFNTLLVHNSREGTVNESLGIFNSAQDADVAAHNFYNPLSQIAGDEIQWYVVNIGKSEAGKDQFQATYGSIGSMSKYGNAKGVDTNAAMSVLRESYSGSNIMMSGHTHWDNNQNFSGKDTRFNNSVVNYLNNQDFVSSVSTSNGSYRVMNYKYSKNKNNLKLTEPPGKLMKDILINTQR